MQKELKTYLISLIPLISMGCATITPRMNIQLTGEMDKDFAVNSIEGAYEGYEKLFNCNYLMDKYPEQFNKILDLRKGLVIHQMNEEEIQLESDYLRYPYCGCAQNFGTIVNLNPETMYDPGCKFSRTIPHEILHLVGFNHETKKEKEEFKTILFECGIK